MRTMRRTLLPLLVVLIGAITLWQREGETPPPVPVETGAAAESPAPSPDRFRAGNDLPDEARDTVELIRQGGPFPYRQDGTTFGNREGLLPDESRGYYREYTVPTPGSRDRGARRIVTGGAPPAVWYYTDDHYRSFRPFEPD
jgi:guanyl-specific ribonuclease Sa